VHSEKFDDHGGVKAALNPAANIKVGAQILEEYVRRGGSVEAGLKSYVGAAMHRTDGGYGVKVMSEYRRLKLVARGKNVPITAKTVMIQARHQVSVDEELAVSDQDETIAASEEEKIKNQM
jgi:hypothetical protein